MNCREKIQYELRGLDFDREAAGLLREDIASLTRDLKALEAAKDPPGFHRESLLRECEALQLSLRLTENRIRRTERLLEKLEPEERRILEVMLVRPYPNCSFDLMDELHIEKSQLYRRRRAALDKLVRLRSGDARGKE